jgi:hypothetical protein
MLKLRTLFLVVAGCVVSACAGVPLRARGEDGGLNSAVEAIAVDPAGNALVVGTLEGQVFDFAGTRMTSAGKRDVFVAKLDPAGNQVWARLLGDEEDQFGLGIAVDGAGNVVFIGGFRGKLDFGGAVLESAGSYDVFIAKLDPAGRHVWSRRFGGEGWDVGTHVVLGRSGELFAAGSFQRRIVFDGSALTTPTDATFLVALDGEGRTRWARKLGSDGILHTRIGQIAATTDGVALIGEFTGTVDLGAGPLTSTGREDIFVARLASTGRTLWSRRFGNEYLNDGTAIAVDGEGNLIVAGEFYGRLDLGGTPLVSTPRSHDGRPSLDSFLAKLGPDGSHLWSLRFGDDSDEYAKSVAVDGAGNVIFTEHTFGTSSFGSFGGVPLGSKAHGGENLGRFDGTGHLAWSMTLQELPANGYHLAVDAAGDVFTAGDYFYRVTLGEIHETAGRSALVVKLDPEGHVLWSRAFSAPAPSQERGQLGSRGSPKLGAWMSARLNQTHTVK